MGAHESVGVDEAVGPSRASFRDMVWIPGGTFLMGSDAFYPEERPAHRVTVDGFWTDKYPVTNAEFRSFIEDTGYITVAERAPNPNDYPGVDPALLVFGSLVFRRPPHQVGLHDFRAWWAYIPGACWKHPEGPESSLTGRDRHPVVHIAYEDAEAYAMWAGKALPTEAEWEFAARGGLEGAVFVWGDEFAPEGRLQANTWQGEFPWQNLMTDGYGLHDMAGNVWEWTCDFFTPRHRGEVAKACCIPRNPRVTSAGQSYAADSSGAQIPRRVLKGGSHLCASNYSSATGQRPDRGKRSRPPPVISAFAALYVRAVRKSHSANTEVETALSVQKRRQA